MHVFVTGAAGWVGSAVVQDLIGAGYLVTGLSRSDKGEVALRGMGADVLRGNLSDLDSLKRGVERADAVMHLGFNHDFSKMVENCEEDRRAIEVMGAALEGSERPILVTSGVAMLAQGRLATEDDNPMGDFPRRSDAAARALAERGIRASSVRLPPTTHGHGDHGFVPMLIDLARQKGVSAYVGDGQNRWAATHRLDAAKVYRLALEHGVQQGPFHAVAEEGVPFKAIAEVIGRRLNLPVVSLSREDAAGHFGWFAMFAGLDLAASSERTRSLLGWQPTQPGLLEDMDDEAYFGSGSHAG